MVLCLSAQSCQILHDPMDCSLPGSSVHGDSPGKNTGVGSHSLLQGVFMTQRLNTGLPHCRQILYQLSYQGSPSGKEPACQCRKHKRCRFSPWVGKIPWRRAWQPTPVFLPGDSHGQRSLVVYGPWGHEESDTIEMTEDAHRSNYFKT